MVSNPGASVDQELLASFLSATRLASLCLFSSASCEKCSIVNCCNPLTRLLMTSPKFLIPPVECTCNWSVHDNFGVFFKIYFYCFKWLVIIFTDPVISNGPNILSKCSDAPSLHHSPNSSWFECAIPNSFDLELIIISSCILYQENPRVTAYLN